jgi:hypothetical protein
VQQTVFFFRKPWFLALMFHPTSTTWLMQASPVAINFLSPTEMFIITYMSGKIAISGLCCLTSYDAQLFTLILSSLQNKEKLFNLQHSQLRNIIERIFGVIKYKFKMAAESSVYPIHIQTVVPIAITTLLNFIHHHQESNFLSDVSSHLLPPQDPHGDQVPTIGVSEQEAEEADWNCEEIATAMWVSYQEELVARSSL